MPNKMFAQTLLFSLLALGAGLNAQTRIEAYVRSAPLNEDYLDAIDEWGWEKYYAQHWDSLALVFGIAERRSRAGVPDDELQYRLNLLSRIRVGQARAEQGDFHAGVAAMEAALREGETQFGPNMDWSFYHVALALIYEKAGNLNKAVLAHQQASRILGGAVREGDANYFLVGNKEANLGRIYSVCNQYPEAAVHYQRAIEAYRRAGEPGLVRVGSAYAQRATTLAELGQFAAAYAELAQLEKLPSPYQTPWLTQAARAKVAAIRGDAAAAIAAYRRALRYGRSYIQPLHPFPAHRSRAFLEIRRDAAQYLIQRGRYAEAWTVLEEAAAIGAEFMSGDPEFHHPIRLLQAEMRFTEGAYAAALAVTEQLVADILDVPGYRWRDPVVRPAGNHSPYLAAVLALQARCLFASYRNGTDGVGRSAVLDNCAAGQAIIEEILLSHTSEFKYSELLEEYRALYDLPVRLAGERLLATGSEAAKNELFQAMERAKNYDLSVEILLRRTAQRAGKGLQRLLEDKLARSARLRSLERRLIDSVSVGKSATEEADLQLALRNVQWAIDSLDHEIGKQYPDYVDQQRQTKQSCRLAELQAGLRPREILVSYHYGDSLLTAVAISRQDFRVAVLPARPIAEAVERFRTLVRTPTTETLARPDAAWRTAAFSLYDQLIGSLIDGMSGESLIIIPHGPLSYLPWAALLTDPDSGGADWRSQPYLINRFTLRTELSATTFRLQRSLPYVAPSDLYLGMAPRYSKAGPVAQNGLRGQALESVFPGYFRQSRENLRYNADEIEAVKGQFAERQVFLGLAAVEAEFKTWAPSARYIHLAAHGFANTTHPSYSHLALVPENSAEDGLVFTDEIYNTPLRAELVVLSACGTGDGGYRSGSGVQSLARAFRAAGSREVLMSLWPIEDQTTFELMTDFFRELPQSNTATALQRSMQNHLATAKNDAFTHPYYWAGFSLQGSDSFAGSTSPFWTWRGWLAGGILLLLLGWYRWRRRAIR